MAVDVKVGIDSAGNVVLALDAIRLPMEPNFAITLGNQLRKAARKAVKRATNGIVCAFLMALVLGGCFSAAPQEMVALEDAGSESIARYYENSHVGINALREWGLLGHQTVIDLLAEASIDNATEEIMIPRGEGEEPLRREIVDPVIAKRTLVEYRGKIEELRARVGEFDAKWDEAQADYLDAMDLRRQIREWFTRTGVRPEHIDAVSRALEGKLREGK